MQIIIGNNTQEAMKLLGLTEYPFTTVQLKTAFREKAKETHPDMNPNAGDAFKHISAAYEKLQFLCVDNLPSQEGLGLNDALNDMFDITEQCPSCFHGTIRENVHVESECRNCKGTGFVELSCKYCNNGKFTTQSGLVVNCKACRGSGIWKAVPCRVCNDRVTQHLRRVGMHTVPPGRIEHTEIRYKQCSTCKGTGRVERKMFNPVIPKGAVLR